jgi:hypothetical protein
MEGFVVCECEGKKLTGMDRDEIKAKGKRQRVKVRRKPLLFKIILSLLLPFTFLLLPSSYPSVFKSSAVLLGILRFHAGFRPERPRLTPPDRLTHLISA